MSKGEIIRSFNSILENFLQQVSPLIGTSYCHYFKQFIKANCILPIQYFINYIQYHFPIYLNLYPFFNNIDVIFNNI